MLAHCFEMTEFRVLPKYFVMAIILALFGGLTVGTGTAQPSFTEDFSTTDFMDPIDTTADWDTGAAELRLNPFAPTRVGSFFVGANTLGLEISGDFAYLANGTGGLRIVDISDVTSPTLRAAYLPGDEAHDVDVVGDLACIAEGNSGLKLFDVTSPMSVTLLGTANLTGFAYGVDIDGQMAYVADGTSGLAVIDIFDPTTPVVLAYYNTAGTTYDVFVDGDFAYLADSVAGLVVLDITQPATPVLAWGLALPGTAQGIWVAGDHVYIAAGNGGLHIVDRAPGQPTGSLIATYVAPNYVYSVSVSGNEAFVCDEDGGLVIVDVTNPAMPTTTGSIGTNSAPRAVRVVGRYAFVADEEEGLEIIRVGTDVEPTVAAVIQTGNFQKQIVIRGDWSYVAGAERGLQVFDNTDPASPVLVGSYNADGTMNANGVAVAGNYAYVADGSNEALVVVDISDPTSPQFTGGGQIFDSATGVVVDGNYAYLTGLGSLLVVMDITDPTFSGFVDEILTDGGIGPMAIHGDTLYMIDTSGQVRVIDISDPTSVADVNTLGGLEYVDLAVAGNYLYVAADVDGMLVFDITDPFLPIYISYFFGPDGARGIAIDGDRALLTRMSGGLTVVDISTPPSPALLSDSFINGYNGHITIDGQFAYVDGGVSGMRVFQIAQSVVLNTVELGQSLDVLADDNTPLRVRLTSQQTGNVSWEFSNTSTGFQRPITNDNSWVALPFNNIPGLTWRAHLTWQYGTPTAVSEIHLEWLIAEAIIQSITDIGNDQGRQVRVEWLRSAHDFVGDVDQIAEYAIYRRIDNNLPGKALGKDLSGTSSAVQMNAEAMKAAGWDFVTAVPVLVEDEYAVVVPTLADSTIAEGQYFSTFKVVALTATPGVFFTSAADSGYSLDNLAPNVPADVVAAYQPDGVDLGWTENTETDFRNYRVYRGTDPGFVPGPEYLVQELTGNAWTDASANPWAYHYKVSAVDFSGNESEAGGVTTVSDVPGAQPAFVLHDAAPNPFNPSTEISYRIARAGKVQLFVYDVSGRRVATLVDEDQTAGAHQVVWQGQDQQGKAVASGVYLYQLRSAGTVAWRRMTLLK